MDGKSPNAETSGAVVEAFTYVVRPPSVLHPLGDVDERMHNDDSNFWSDGDEDPTSCAANVDPVMEQALDVSIEVEADTALPFKEEYVKSI